MTAGSHLWRNGLGSNPAFPYSLGALGSITGTTVGGGNALEYYYFFYDWDVVNHGTSCYSPRVDVLVTVGPNGINEGANAQGFNVYPVPTSDLLNIDFGMITGSVDVDVIDITGRMVITHHTNANSPMKLDVSSLAAGQYELRVRHANGTELRRVDVR
jgi:hypothetical protein